MYNNFVNHRRVYVVAVKQTSTASGPRIMLSLRANIDTHEHVYLHVYLYQYMYHRKL